MTDQQAHAFEESQRRLKEAQKLAHVGYVEWNIAERQAWWSDEIYRIHGFEPGEVVPTGELMLRMIHPDDVETIRRVSRLAISSGSSQPLAYRIVRDNGEIRNVHGRLLAIMNQMDGPRRLVSTLQDVTEYQRIADEVFRHRASLAAGQRIARMGTWHWELGTDVLWWSEEIDRLIGARPGTTPSLEAFLEAAHPDDRQQVIDAVTAAREIGTPIDLEIRIPTPDGDTTVLQSSGEVLVDDSGTPYRIIGIIQDITERKRIEEELRRNQASLAAGQRVARLGTWDWNILTNDIWWSDEIDRLFEFEPGKVKPSFALFLDALHPGDRQRSIEAVETALDDCRPYDMEVRIPQLDGSLLVAHSSGEIFVDDDGRPVRMVGAIQDITERKRIEEELRRNRATLAAGQQLVRLGTWEWSIGTNEAWLSDETYSIMGLAKGEAIPSTDLFMSAIHPEDRRAVMATIETAIAERQPYDIEIRLAMPDGSIRLAQARGEATFGDDGRPVRMIGAIQDITERKQIEEDLALARDQALEASRLKSEFLATMSHEIRTPMNGVMGMLDLLLDSPLNSQQHDFAVSARESADALLTLINDILDFSRIEAGKMILDRADFDLTAVVEGSAEVLATRARAQRVSLMTYVDPAIPPVLQGDRGRLRQVLVNLIGNAVKFTERGEVTVRAALEDEYDDHATIRFTVTDTGIGIAENVQKRLFQAFSQADATTTRKYGGTGLGLAIVKRLVNLMGGDVGVDSTLGKGSTFWFSIPFHVASHTELTSPITPNRDVTGLRVMIVDNLETTREIVHSYVVSWGMRNGSVSNARDALALLRKAAAEGDPYDVAIVDMAMPDIDGFALASEISSDRALAGTCLILLTAFDRRGQGEDALRQGFSGYLTKPVRKSQLFDAIVNGVSARELSQAPEDRRFATTQLPAPEAEPENLDGASVVLLAEDNPVNQKVARIQIEKLGYCVQVVDNGRKAVEAASDPERYALILMDVQMPEMDGFEATRAIRRAEISTGRHIPIIAMTANAMEGDREACLAAGMDDYLSKPVNRDKLRDVLECWMPDPNQPARD